MKRLLITGASGLLGLNYAIQFMNRHQVVGVCGQNPLHDVPFKMIHRDFFTDSVDEMLDTVKPQAVLHCAAMANIDTCEKNPDAARTINAVLPGKIAKACGERNIRLICISTDAMFDGKDSGETGYRETDTVHPNNVYSSTKYAGEQNTLSANPNALVTRVNFFGWSISQKRSLGEIFYHNLAEGKKMMGFTDVIFCPLCINDLADILDRMLWSNISGLYHVYSSEHQSKYEFGVSIARRFGLDPELIKPVSWKDAGLTAVRSPNLVMNTDKLTTFLGKTPPGQKETMERFYQSYKDGVMNQMAAFGQRS